MKEKSQLSEKVVPLIKDLKAKHGKQVKFIRCDNAGENKILEATCKKEGLGIIFEFTAPGTPQQNGMVERAFATLYGSMRAMMNLTCFPCLAFKFLINGTTFSLNCDFFS